jgi:hypothetical protein
VLNADGSFTYTPNADFNGADSFTYTVSDGDLSDSGTVTITVLPVNDPPVAVLSPDDQTIELGFGADLDASASSDVDGDALNFVWTGEGTSDGPDSHTVNLGAIGDYPYSVTVNDPAGETDSAWANITVIDTTDPEITLPAACTDGGLINITPNQVPVSFNADIADLGGFSVDSSFSCHMVNGAGRTVDKADSCVVDAGGDTITVLDSGGVGDNIVWTVTATDPSGNTSTSSCTIFVHNPSGTDEIVDDPGEVKGNGNGNSGGNNAGGNGRGRN